MLSGVAHAAAGLLVVAGAQKTRDPQPLVRAARSTGLPVPATVVRGVAAGEVLLGLVVLLDGSRAAAALLAASYALFTAFVLLARRRGGVLASCGCFGKADVPPTRTHALVTAALAAAAATGAPGPLVLDAALLVTTAGVAVTAYLVLAVLPLLAAP